MKSFIKCKKIFFFFFQWLRSEVVTPLTKNNELERIIKCNKSRIYSKTANIQSKSFTPALTILQERRLPQFHYLECCPGIVLKLGFKQNYFLTFLVNFGHFV